jgi:TRAP-type mannitol/chloroaromatic compound transport system permease small subunit
MKFFIKLDKIVDWLSRAAIMCAGILLMLMAINITYGVIARYAFSAPSVYAMELTKLLMIPALVFAVAYVQRYSRHLQVDFLINRLTTRIRLLILDVFVPLAGLFVGYVLVRYGWESMLYSYSMNEVSYSSWAEPLWPVRLTIVIGYVILCLVMIAQVIKGIVMWFAGDTTRMDVSGPMAESEQV